MLAIVAYIALAYATELAFGNDPLRCHWDHERMRFHLQQCLESGEMCRFPCSDVRHIRLGTRVIKSIPEDIFCICRLPNEKNKSMIECESCRKWFHHQCMGLDETPRAQMGVPAM